MPSYIDCQNCSTYNTNKTAREEELVKLRETNCKTCPSDGSQIDNTAIIEKRIQNKVRISSSLYTMKLGASIPDSDVGKKPIKKNDSYARYLAKRKYGCLC